MDKYQAIEIRESAAWRKGFNSGTNAIYLWVRRRSGSLFVMGSDKKARLIRELVFELETQTADERLKLHKYDFPKCYTEEDFDEAYDLLTIETPIREGQTEDKDE